MKTIYQCPGCGSRDVEASQWFKINSDKPSASDAPIEGFYCNGCEEHHDGLDTVHGPRQLCEGCAHAAWGTDCPMEGVIIMDGGDVVEKCDECEIYETDLEAAQALAAEHNERECSVRVRIIVEGA